jgi:capsular polysaccharide biosynthesis protein
MIRLPPQLRPLFPYAKHGVVRLTQVVGPVTRRLPGTERRPAPPHRVSESTADHARSHPGLHIDVVEVEPVYELDRPLPEGRPPGHEEFAAHRLAHVPAAVVARIPHGRLVDRYCAVVTPAPDDTLLYDLSPYFGTFHARQHPIFLRTRLPAVHDVAGSVYALAARGGDNYYHFLTDVLPRLELLRKTGVDLGAATFVVNRTTPFQREMLDQLGIPEERCLQVARHPHIRATELVVPSLPDAHLRTPPWIVPWLRAHFLPADPAASSRRLYVTRGTAKHTRRVDNEAEVLRALEPLGFVRVDPGELSVAEQIRHFAEAECVVGAHGAGLTNVAFCPPGAAMVELFAPDYVNVCYWALASTVEGLRYRYVVGDGLPTGASSRNNGVMSDVRVDPRAVARLVGELLGT